MALDDLPTGEMLCEYNGHVFGPATDTTAFSVRPVLDPAGRTVIYAVYTLTVTDTIADAETTDPIVERAIAKLSRNGGILLYRGRGFGDLDVNTGRDRDVKWGPHVREVSAKPTGAGKAVELTATFEFALVNCPDGLSKAGTVLAFTFELSFDIDTHGYTTRTTTATLTIAQTRKRVGDRALFTSADEHREDMVPELPSGFRRLSQSFRLSPDKCTIVGTIHDVQTPPNRPRPGLVDGSIEHSYSSHPNSLGFMWTGTISATYDIDRATGTPQDAADDFERLAATRIALRASRMRKKDGTPAAIVPQVWSVTEPNVLGRTQARFTLSYFIGGAELDQILLHGGLWQPWDGGGIDPRGGSVWEGRMGAASWAPRGHAGLAFRPGDDGLVDACGVSEPVTPAARPPAGNQGVSPLGRIVGAAKAIAGGVKETVPLQTIFPPPEAKSSWLMYQSHVTLVADTGRILATTLPDAPLGGNQAASAGRWDVMAGALPAQGSNSPFPPLADLLRANQRAESTFVQQRTAPTLRVILTGQALRIGYPIPVPELVSVGGKRPTLIGEPMFAQGIVGTGLYPIVGANWRLEYAWADGELPAGAIPVPPNPDLA